MLRDDEFREVTRKERDFEHDNVTGKNEEDSVLENTPVKVLTAKSIIGDKVVNTQGEKLGDIKDIMLNVTTGCAEYVVIEFGGILGIGEKFFAIPFKALSLNPDRQVFIIDKTKSELKSVPGFDKDHWPETNSRHFDDVNYFWGYMGPRGVTNSDAGFTI
jgi:sporulation protein YlmC with PRC-barrel domain